MNFKRILGILIIIVGIVMMFFAHYIKEQVAAGELVVEGAQKKVDKADSTLSITPYTKPLGQAFTDSAQKKIDAGKDEIAHYTAMAKWLQIGGIVVIVIGVVTVIFGKSKPGRRSR